MHFRYHYSLLCAAEKPLTTLKAGVFPVVVRPKDEVPWTLRRFQILRVNDNPVESVSTLQKHGDERPKCWPNDPKAHSRLGTGLSGWIS